MKLPPGWIELNLKGRSFQREDLLLVRVSGKILPDSADRFEILFLDPACFDAGDEEAFDDLERACGPYRSPRKPGWLAAMLSQYKSGLAWEGAGTMTSELLFEIDRLFRRRDIFAPSPDVHRELSDRERIELLEQQVAELKRRLDASE